MQKWKALSPRTYSSCCWRRMRTDVEKMQEMAACFKKAVCVCALATGYALTLHTCAPGSWSGKTVLVTKLCRTEFPRLPAPRNLTCLPKAKK